MARIMNGLQEIDRRRLIETLSQSNMSYCGKCESIYSNEMWHRCDEKNAQTGTRTKDDKG